jgi:hypothetical protein
MTNDMMNLKALMEKSADADLLCRATIRMRVRVASARDVPEGPDHCLT